MLWSQVEWLLSRKGPMQAASASQSMQSVEQGALRARHAELGGQLRVAVMEGDEARIRRLLSELLRPGSEQSPANLGAAEGAAEPRAVAPLCHGDARAHRALHAARL